MATTTIEIAAVNEETKRVPAKSAPRYSKEPRCKSQLLNVSFDARKIATKILKRTEVK